MIEVASGSGNKLKAGVGLGVPSHVMAAPEMLHRPSQISGDTGYTSTPVSTRPNSQRTIPRQDSHSSNIRNTPAATSGNTMFAQQSKSGSLGKRPNKTRNVTGKLYYMV